RAYRPSRAQHGERERSGSGAGLEDPGSGKDVGPDQDRTEVLGIDRLGLSAAAGDLLGEGRPDGQESSPELGRHDHPFRPADEVVVLDEAGMDGVAFAGAKPDPMAPSQL